MSQQRFKIVMNTLLRDIFQRKLKPGDKLPTERELSEKMGVDRTSLRIGLKQLESMEVLGIRQGDGIYVKNYMKNAGLDFLRLLFLQQEADENEVIIDEYIIDEVLEFWEEFMPMMIKIALRRFVPRDIKNSMDMLNAELENIHDRDKVIESEILQQEMVAERTDNLLFVLITNSTRPLRKKMIELFVNAIDDDTLRQHIENKKALFRALLIENMENHMEIVRLHKEALKSYHDTIRQSWRQSSEEIGVTPVPKTS